jgi:hypothetical protein
MPHDQAYYQAEKKVEDALNSDREHSKVFRKWRKAAKNGEESNLIYKLLAQPFRHQCLIFSTSQSKLVHLGTNTALVYHRSNL